METEMTVKERIRLFRDSSRGTAVCSAILGGFALLADTGIYANAMNNHTTDIFPSVILSATLIVGAIGYARESRRCGKQAQVLEKQGF